MATTTEIAEFIYAHAEKHYNKGGWDVIVECWTVQMIEDAMIEAGNTTPAYALAQFCDLASIWADQQADAINSAF